MNNITKFIKIKLVELTLKKNRILGRLRLLPSKTQTYGPLKNILEMLTSSNIDLQLYKKDGEDKDYIFSIIQTLEQNGVQFTLTEFDKIFSDEDIQNISRISKTARINFRYVYPNYMAGINISTEMPIDSYLETLKKIKHLVKVATLNFSTKEEQIIFIASQLSEYTKYDFEYDKKSEREYYRLSSLQGCLEDRSTVCSGVALAFERCMTEMNIENMLVMGYGGKEKAPRFHSNHVWNKVKINGKWYNVDVTNILMNALPYSTIPAEERIKKYILSSDKTLADIGNTITDNSNIPVSEEDFARTLEIYKRISKAKNVLTEYDNGNMTTFLQYNTENNSIVPKVEQSQEIERDNSEDKSI